MTGFRWIVIAALMFLSASAAQAQQNDYVLTYSVDAAEHPELASLMGQLPVQRLLLRLAQQPHTEIALDAVLRDAGVSREQLERLKLIRRDNGRYVINFLLMTRTDMARIRMVTDHYAQSLATALLARRSEIEAALKSYDAAAADRSAVAYFILGCFSLDWDGLRLTEEKGYRKDPPPDSPAAQFGWWVQERNEFTWEKYFWGSHNSTYGTVALTSFGDHAASSQPRWALPDLVWLLPRRATQGNVPNALKPALSRFVDSALQRTAERMGLIMLALRDNPKNLTELVEAAKLDKDEAEDLLSALVELDYVRQNGGRYEAIAPVLAARDLGTVEGLRRIGREVMEQWFAENYTKLRADLADVTPWRYGQPFPEAFYQIWHCVFGAANRRLVEAGLFADPYSESRRFKGYIPVVFRTSLAESP